MESTSSPRLAGEPAQSHHYSRILASTALGVVLSLSPEACDSSSAHHQPSETTVTTPVTPHHNLIQPTTPHETSAGTLPMTIDGMPAREAIAQTFILGFDAATPKATIRQVVSETKVGGIFLTGTTDARAEGFTPRFFNRLSRLAGHYMLVASDEEGGKVHRFAYSQRFPRAKVMGAKTAARVRAIAKVAGSQMHADRIDIDLAPVLDLDNGKYDGAISRYYRSFGAQPANVTRKAGAFAAGLRASGIIPVLKHFPGIGFATPNSNTDAGKAYSPPLSILKSRDTFPYQTIIAKQPDDLVMLSNEYVRGIDVKHPASVSRPVVRWLRHDFGYKGIITTDDLRSITGYDGQLEPGAIASSMKAGADMPLFSYNSTLAIQKAITMIRNQVPTKQLTRHVTRVMQLKANLHK
jgi:beta-N-acetylhexosaminidase